MVGRSRIWIILGGIISLCGIVLFAHLVDSFLFVLVSFIIQRRPKTSWTDYIQVIGIGLFLLGGLIILTTLYLSPRLRIISNTLGRKINRLEDRIETGLKPIVVFEKPSVSGYCFLSIPEQDSRGLSAHHHGR
jgi:hypothetical protein